MRKFKNPFEQRIRVNSTSLHKAISKSIALAIAIVVVIAAIAGALALIYLPRAPVTLTTTPTTATTPKLAKITWNMGTTKEGTTGYVMIGLMAELLTRYGGEYFDCRLAPYGSSTAGLKGYDMKEVHSMYASLQQVEQIVTRTGPFGPPTYNWTRSLAQFIWMYNIKWFWIVRPEVASRVRGWSDLKGLRVWPQMKGTSTYEFMQVVLGPNGLSIWGTLDIKTFDISQAADALKVGEVDAVAGYNGAGFVVEVLTRNPSAVIVFPTPEEIEKMLKAAPFVTVTTLYPEEIGVPGALKEPAKTVGVPFVYIVDPNFSEEHIYLATKILLEHADELAKSNALWREFAADPLKFNIPLWERTCKMGVPLHQGVIRYLKERGVSIEACKV
jgi:TRAP transporter TAXI family solute receptor